MTGSPKQWISAFPGSKSLAAQPHKEKLMFRTLLKATAIILLGTLSLSAQNSTSAASSVPRLVNYSGKTIDAQNKPISGTVGVDLYLKGFLRTFGARRIGIHFLRTGG
jgi:hypothetical protein